MADPGLYVKADSNNSSTLNTICSAKLSTSCGFTKGGKCGCFVLINKWHGGHLGDGWLA